MAIDLQVQALNTEGNGTIQITRTLVQDDIDKLQEMMPSFPLQDIDSIYINEDQTIYFTVKKDEEHPRDSGYYQMDATGIMKSSTKYTTTQNLLRSFGYKITPETTEQFVDGLGFSVAAYTQIASTLIDKATPAFSVISGAQFYTQSK